MYLRAAVAAVFADEAFVAVVVKGGAGAAVALADGFGDAPCERVVVVVGEASVCIAEVG